MASLAHASPSARRALDMGAVKTSGIQGIRTSSMGSWAAWVLDSLPYSPRFIHRSAEKNPSRKPDFRQMMISETEKHRGQEKRQGHCCYTLSSRRPYTWRLTVRAAEIGTFGTWLCH